MRPTGEERPGEERPGVDRGEARRGEARRGEAPRRGGEEARRRGWLQWQERILFYSILFYSTVFDYSVTESPPDRVAVFR